MAEQNMEPLNESKVSQEKLICLQNVTQKAKAESDEEAEAIVDEYGEESDVEKFKPSSYLNWGASAECKVKQVPGVKMNGQWGTYYG